MPEAALPPPPIPNGGEAYGAWWDEDAAQRACEFFPAYLRHTEGEWAGRPFHLTSWQRDRLVRPIFGLKRADGTRLIRFVWLEVPRKNGKGLDVDEVVPTPGGWRRMGDLQAGDLVFDKTGTPVQVLRVSATHHGLRCWRLTFADGSSVVADEQHRWLTRHRARPWDGVRSGDHVERVVTTPQIATSVTVERSDGQVERNHLLPIAGALTLPPRKLPIHPYLLGQWLGNGTAAAGNISVGDQDAVAFEQSLQALGVAFRRLKDQSGKCPVYSCAKAGLGRDLRALSLIRNKHIPEAYLWSGTEQRWQLLQGLMDTDGNVGKNGGKAPRCYFDNTNKSLADDVLQLVRSLGFKATQHEGRAHLNGVDHGPCWTVAFHATRDQPVFRLARKQSLLGERLARRTRSSTNAIVACDEVESRPTVCIQVDSSSHLFLVGQGMVPTHNTEFAAGLSLALMFCDMEVGGQGYSLAVDSKQSRIVFEKASVMASLNEGLQRRLELLRTSIYCPALMSSFKPLSAGPKGKHGLSPSFAIGDEVHEWTAGAAELADVVHKGTVARRQPLEVYITTAGVKGDSYAAEMHDLAEQVIRGEVVDPTMLVVIYAASETADWKAEETWREANPNYGISVKPDYMRREAEKAARTPRAENEFKRFHLNLWTEQVTRWLPMDAWRTCTRRPSDPETWKVLRDELAGEVCYGGLDLSITRDTTSLALVFPPSEERPRWTFLWRFWLPEETVRDQTLARRVQYEAMAAKGALTLTSGNVVDYDFIRAAIIQDRESFDLRWLGIDRFNASQLAVQLREQDDLPVEYFGQGFVSMNAPSKEFERLVVSSKLEHGNNPVATWMARNATVATDAAGNIKPDKARAADKIDGIVAAIMALGGAVANASKNKPSVYERRGLLVL